MGVFGDPADPETNKLFVEMVNMPESSKILEHLAKQNEKGPTDASTTASTRPSGSDAVARVADQAGRVGFEKKKLMMDAAAASDKQELEEQKVSGQLQLESMRVGAQIKESQAKQQFEQERAGIQMGAEIAKNQKQMDLQARTAALQHTSRNQPKTEPKS